MKYKGIRHQLLIEKLEKVQKRATELVIALRTLISFLYM